MGVQFVSAKLSGAWVSCSGEGLEGDAFAAEHLRRRSVAFALGYGALVAGNCLFALAPSLAGMTAGWACVGVHMGLTHSLIQATLQSYTPDGMAGTAFSLFDIACAPVLFSANLLAGTLSQQTVAAGMGPVGAFYMGGAATLASGALLLLAHSPAGALGDRSELNLSALSKRRR